MLNDIGQVYRRAFDFAATLPMALLPAFLLEMLQHLVEMRLGFFADPAGLTAQEGAIRLGFGLLKIVSLVLTLVFALRWWRFDGDVRRALRPTSGLLKGLVVVALVQLAGDALFVAIGLALGRLFGAVQIFVATAFLLWLLVALLLVPWYVGLLTDDGAMTAKRSVAAIRPVWLSAFVTWLCGIFPLMAVHYALNFAAMRGAGALFWGLLTIDAAIVAMLIIAIASTYLTIYRKAAIWRS